MRSLRRGPLAAARLHLRAARRRPAASIAAIASVTAAVTLGVSVWVVTDSIHTNVENVARLAGRATFEISGPRAGEISPETVDAIAALDGVAAAVPIVRSNVEVGGRVVPV